MESCRSFSSSDSGVPERENQSGQMHRKEAENQNGAFVRECYDCLFKQKSHLLFLKCSWDCKRNASVLAVIYKEILCFEQNVQNKELVSGDASAIPQRRKVVQKKQSHESSVLSLHRPTYYLPSCLCLSSPTVC